MTNVGSRNKSPIRRIVVGGVLLAAAATAAGTFVHLQRIAAEIPSPNASSAEVLHVYLAAAKNHDCAVTEALSVSGDERHLAWCGGRTPSLFNTHPDLLTYKNIGSPIAGPTLGASGLAERCYPVDITEANMNGAEPGPMPGWQFCFAKTPSGWRLADEGYG